MARTRNRTTRSQATVTVDAIDEIVAKLNTIEGIEFVRDAWVNKAPDNYGVVELPGESRQLWADGHLLDSIWMVRITAYVTDGDDTWAGDINEKLEELEADGKVELTHTIGRNFNYEVGKVEWVWTVYITGPLTREEPAPEPPAESGANGEG